jgi:hypothetical protein
MNAARAQHTASFLKGGLILVAGGVDASSETSAETYSPGIGVWSPTTNLNAPHRSAASGILSNGTILVAGGLYGDTAEVYDLNADVWTLTPNLAAARELHTASVLANGTVLVAGGQSMAGGAWLKSAELFSLSLAQGTPCKLPGDCASGFCSGGFCCDQACGGCAVCAVALGASANGTCTLLQAGSAGSPSCSPALCDGTNPACPSTCTSDAGCVTAAYCRPSDQTCQPKQMNGSPCTSPSQCLSGECASDVCVAPSGTGGSSASSSAGPTTGASSSAGGTGGSSASSSGTGGSSPPHHACACRAAGGDPGPAGLSALALAATCAPLRRRRRPLGR